MYNPISFAAFKAKAPQSATPLRAFAFLSDYYNYEWRNRKSSHYSVSLRQPEPGQLLHAYIAKDAEGERLFKYIQDGEAHPVFVVVSHRGTQADMVEIEKILGLDFTEVPEEFAYVKEGSR